MVVRCYVGAESHSGPLEAQPVLLTTESRVQSLERTFNTNKDIYNNTGIRMFVIMISRAIMVEMKRARCLI